MSALSIELGNVTCLASSVKHFDLHADFGLAYLVEDRQAVTLYLNDRRCRSWPNGDYPDIFQVKWFDRDHVIMETIEASAAIISAESWEEIQLGWIYGLLLSRDYIFVTYTEESLYSSRGGELEGNFLSVFSRDGRFEFGLRELLDKDRDAHRFDEISAGYTFNNYIVFIAFDTDFLWILDAATRAYRKVPVSFSTVAIDVLTGDEKKAYAIFDNRKLLSHHPDWPMFELAVFDLVAATSAKEDFGPVETALAAAGFEVRAIKLQPSSTGKIIVSDNEKAAFLEFSDGV